jgi:hypothetical protein
MPAARGVTGRAERESGQVIELASVFSVDDLRLHGSWDREMPGSYRVVLRKPGFVTKTIQADVREDRCHVIPALVEATLEPDPGAIEQEPISFVSGPDIDVSPANAGAQVHGDTLTISGVAPSACRELRAVAFRSGDDLHVQIEPSDVPLEDCVRSGNRPFEVRYRIPAERTELLVTNGFAVPTELFRGRVRLTDRRGVRGPLRADQQERPGPRIEQILDGPVRPARIFVSSTCSSSSPLVKHLRRSSRSTPTSRRATSSPAYSTRPVS